MNKWSNPAISFFVFLIFLMATASARADKPNILWIYAEDTSPWMGCYGHEANAGATRQIDSLAHQGVLFRRAYVPAPVCSACRSAIMGGMNQIRFNAHEHRSSRGPAKL
ncbi:MAG: sulfatase-like hydrolase/transferase, partial [Opitutae bacterium]|nr:sulfatase-like hydrolase/transferase [Opitutae bacterium]